MDPVSVFSIVTGAAGIAMQCAKIAKSLHDLSGKVGDARLFVLSVKQELDIVRLAWEQIEQLLRSWEDHGMDSNLLQRLEQQIELGDVILTALSEDLLHFDLIPISFRGRAKAVWNEDSLKAHQDRIRGQAIAMNLLLSVLQMPSAIERKESFSKAEPILKKSNESALSIVPSRLSSRISYQSKDNFRQSEESANLLYQELSIDDELFTAGVYKRNYRNNFMQFKQNSRRRAESPIADEVKIKAVSDLRNISQHCVWTANVHYLNILDDHMDEVMIEGPLPESLYPAKFPNPISSSSTYPSLRKTISTIDKKSLSKVLSFTRGHFQEWKQCLLYETCRKNNLDLAKILLNHNVWIDGYVPIGNAAPLTRTTPMHIAAYSASLALVTCLMRNLSGYKTNPQDLEDANGYKPIHLAAEVGPVSKVKLLVRGGASINCTTMKTGELPVHMSTKRAATDSTILSYLLRKGASPNSCTAQLDTPLHLACMNNSLARVAILSEDPRTLRSRNIQGWTPLHVACRFGSLGLITKLLEAGAPIDVKDQNGRTPLHISCIRGVLSVVQTVLRLGMDIEEDLESKWSKSPLVVAVTGSNFPIVSELLDKGFSPNFKNITTGKTVLQQAMSQSCFDTTSFMERTKTVGILLEHGANAETKDRKGNNVLHHWAIAGCCSSDTNSNPTVYYDRLQESWCESLLTALIQCGAIVYAQNCIGETPLSLALRQGNLPLAQSLRMAGAREHSLPSYLLDSVQTYNIDYPEPKIESFTAQKAGTIPRHEPSYDE